MDFNFTPKKRWKPINKKRLESDNEIGSNSPTLTFFALALFFFLFRPVGQSPRDPWRQRSPQPCKAIIYTIYSYCCAWNAKWNTKVFRVRKPWIWVSTTSEERWQQYSSLVLPQIRPCLSCESSLSWTILRHLAKVKSRQKEGSHRLDETIRHRACFFLNSFREDSNGFCLSYSNMRNQKMMPYMPYQHQLLTLTQHLLALSESCCLQVRNYRNTWNHRQMSSCPCMHHAQNCRSSRDLFLAGTPAATAMLRPQACWKTKEKICKRSRVDSNMIQTWSMQKMKTWTKDEH